MNSEAYDVLIIGGGPAGLTAAAALAPLVNGSLIILEREEEAGGIPRHSHHLGYGLRDLHRVMTGPAYAKRLVGSAEQAGAIIRTGATVTNWAGDQTVDVTSPAGRTRIAARAIVLATGARERSRSARLIPGDRPSGIYTTGQLQNAVHLHGRTVGTRAVVVGAELVSWSAVLTLRAAGCRTTLMTTIQRTPEAYAAFNAFGRTALRVPVACRTKVTRIIGREQLEAVEIEDLDTGDRRMIACDTLVLTGDWIPDHELARLGGIELDPGTNGPRVDTALRTSRAGVFAAGNVAHAVDTADVAALDGAHVAEHVISYLQGDKPPASSVRIVADDPFRWVAPSCFRAGEPPARHRLLLWSNEFVRVPHLLVTQDGKRLAIRRIPWAASPGRVFRIPSALLNGARPDGGEIHIGLK